MSFVVAISGRGEAGKSTTSRMLADTTRLRYKQSTSEVMAEMIFEKSKDGCFGRSFTDIKECWEHRSEYRELWGKLIAEFNKPCGVTLYEYMLSDSDILDGIRRISELEACRERGIIDLVIWIERNSPIDYSLDYGLFDCDIAIINNGSLSDLAAKVEMLAAGIRNLSLS